MPSRSSYRVGVTLLRTAPTPVAAIGLLLLAGATLTGCSPAPEPTPTPTAAFTSEEEAFAAAEETYRAYNDAGNARRAGDGSPDPQDFLVGAALEGDIDAGNALKEKGLTVTGDVRVESFNGTKATLSGDTAKVVAVVCLDATNARVIDAAGRDVTPLEREPTVAQEVTFMEINGVLRISDESSAEVGRC